MALKTQLDAAKDGGAVMRLSECERALARMEREHAQLLGELEQARRELAELKAAQPRLGELREVRRVAGVPIVGRVVGRGEPLVCADRECREQWGPTPPRAVWACPRCGGEELVEERNGGES